MTLCCPPIQSGPASIPPKTDGGSEGAVACASTDGSAATKTVSETMARARFVWALLTDFCISPPFRRDRERRGRANLVYAGRLDTIVRKHSRGEGGFVRLLLLPASLIVCPWAGRLWSHRGTESGHYNPPGIRQTVF